MSNTRTPKLIGNAVKSMAEMLARVKDLSHETDPVKRQATEVDLAALLMQVEHIGVVKYVDEAQEFAAPPCISAVNIQKCQLCGHDHVNQPLKAYREDGLPHPLYTHWYECPVAKAPNGLYIAGDSNAVIDDQVIEELHKAAATERWLIAVFSWTGRSLERYWKTNDFPKDLIASKGLAAMAVGDYKALACELLLIADSNSDLDAEERAACKRAAEALSPSCGGALDWLTSELCKEVSPPPIVQLPEATVPDTIPLFEGDKKE